MKKRWMPMVILMCLCLLNLCPAYAENETISHLSGYTENTDGTFFYSFSQDGDWSKKLSLANGAWTSFEQSDGINHSGMLSLKPYAGMGAIGSGVDAVTMQENETLYVTGKIRYRNADVLKQNQMYVQIFATGLAGVPLYSDSACTVPAGKAEGGFVTASVKTDTKGASLGDGAWHEFSLSIPSKGMKHSKGSYIDMSGTAVNIWFRPYAGNAFSATTTFFEQAYLDECTENGTTPYADVLLDDLEGFFCTDNGELAYHDTAESMYYPFDTADGADTKAFLAKATDTAYLESCEGQKGVVTLKNPAGSVKTPTWNKKVTEGKKLRVAGDINLLNAESLNADNINVNALLILNGGSGNNPAGFYEDEACTVPVSSVNGNAICHSETLLAGIGADGWTHFSHDFDTTTVYKSSIKRASTDSAKTTVYIKPWEVATVSVWLRVTCDNASNPNIPLNETVFTADCLTSCGYKKENGKWVADTKEEQTTPYIQYALDNFLIQNVTDGALLPGDFKVESATVSKPETLSVGDSVSVSYDVTGGYPETETRTYLLADGEVLAAGRTKGGFTFDVTRDMFGKSLTARILPKSGTVYSAFPYEMDFGTVGGELKNLSVTSTERYTVHFSFDAIGCVPEGTLYLALYKENGQLLSAESIPIAETTHANGIQAEGERTNTDAAKAKLFFFGNGLHPETAFAETEILRHSVFLIGDSICANYKNTDYPQGGWGTYMQEHFTNAVKIENRAVGGKSTSTYLSGGNFDSLLSELTPGDFVLINLAINDDAADERFTSEAQYEENITYFVQSIKQKGATPILVTPHQVARMEWLSKQDVRSNVMKRVAKAENISLIDLNTEMRNRWYGGAEDITQSDMDEAFSLYYLSKTAFSHIEETYGRTISLEKWESIQDENDHIHITFIGAESIADMICDLLLGSDCTIKTYLK